MYTYEPFTLLRPMFITLLVMSIVLCLTIIITKKRQKYINWFTISSISIVNFILANQLLTFHFNILDELNLSEDSIDNVANMMFLAISALSFVNPFLYLCIRAWEQSRQNNNRLNH
ncbi:hypothetical protein [Bacillus solimangrovi]|uniref:Uncharacterized protein n=1 Tax=Bacillus solimangrovi TaxID=1305675 RepID=A0A1E5LHR4_9BACI|nr:hypothetical protein [Bacillus solimangrovi]OEH93629.1 hypothetical protein BFG57_01185 [Bacillus solimangrovi]